MSNKIPFYAGSWIFNRGIADPQTGNTVLFQVYLEKAWALYVDHFQLAGMGNSHANAGYAGLTGNALVTTMALTGVHGVYPDWAGKTRLEYWNAVQMVKDGFPAMAAKYSTDPNVGGSGQSLPGGHEYYVVAAYTDASGQQMVGMRNPWGGDHASGAAKIYSGTSVGGFTMDMNTFMTEFNELNIMLVHPGNEGSRD